MMMFLFLVWDLLQHAKSKFITTKRYSNSSCPTKAHPPKAFYPTSVGPEVSRSFLVVYQFWLDVVMFQVVQHAADFQDHSHKYELSRIWILLKENNDAHETQAGLFLVPDVQVERLVQQWYNKEEIPFRLFTWATNCHNFCR